LRGPLEIDLPLALDRAGGAPLHAQLEQALREAIRAGRLAPGSRLPSTRALARSLGVSRGVAVEAYAQLAAEGYLAAAVGSGTAVAAGTRGADGGRERPERPRAAWDFHPGLPDLAAFPRSAWGRALRRALAEAPDAALGYPNPIGVRELRVALAAYLGRARGTAAEPGRIVVTGGHAQAFGCACRALAARGARRLAVEDPGFPVHRMLARHWGLELVAAPVDAYGVRVDALAATGAGAALVTPAHQSPTGAVLAPARRRELLDWAERADAVVVEDDYDAEFRYDREPVGCLQGLAPERVIYAGSASKTLAPALRLGWLVVPRELVGAVREEKAFDDLGSPALDQLALAGLLERGELDRHLRRIRPRYRARRAALEAALARHLPDVRLSPATAGLHSMARLPAGSDEDAIVAAAAARGVSVHGLSRGYLDPATAQPGFVLGFASQPEAAIERGIEQLAAAVRDVARAAG
jgi:GntR family transcriptional regulator / MocR family aminotransferase